MGGRRDILTSLKGRKVLVVGLARSGLASARLLASRGARVCGTDSNPDPPGAQALVADGVELDLGGNRTERVLESQLVVLSPGVAWHSPMVKAALDAGVPVMGELELGLRLSGLDVIAVTGTNGKSTTTALCAHLLESAGLRVFMGGNIGNPVSGLLLEQRPLDWAVVEVSSFQLEHLSDSQGLVPRVGIWLNLTPDHLDRHGSMENYAATKRRLFEGQNRAQTGIFFADDAIVRDAAGGLGCSQRWFGRAGRAQRLGDGLIEGGRITVGSQSFELTNPRLSGDHNAENAAAAILAATAVGCAAPAVQSGLDTYAGLPHRVEPVRELAGVRWVNDSKGTNPDATAKSLTGFSDGVVLIAGGRGKGTDYRKLRQVVSERVSALVLIGEDAERLAADLDGCAPVHRAVDMVQAVAKARQLALPGGAVLLSPACASFDMFKDYAHRGQVFSDLVMALEVGS
jgi:UDP-N-acetylmuramoylalanine--D-glutamate ligase